MVKSVSLVSIPNEACLELHPCYLNMLQWSKLEKCYSHTKHNLPAGSISLTYTVYIEEIKNKEQMPPFNGPSNFTSTKVMTEF